MVTVTHAAETASIFTKGIVLQQGMPVPVWGTVEHELLDVPVVDNAAIGRSGSRPAVAAARDSLCAHKRATHGSCP
jgi:hypothetical protein